MVDAYHKPLTGYLKSRFYPMYDGTRGANNHVEKMVHTKRESVAQWETQQEWLALILRGRGINDGEV